MFPRTIYLSKLIGLFLILVALSMLVERQPTLDFAAAVAHNHALLVIIGMIGVAAGLAMVLGHNVWSGGVLPVVVTLVGWLTLVRGAFCLFASPELFAKLYTTINFERFVYIPLGLNLVLGLYLTYAGFILSTSQTHH